MNPLKHEVYELLKNDRAIFDFMQDSAFDGLWYWNVNNPKNIWINPRFQKTLGYTAQEIYGDNPEGKSAIHVDQFLTAMDDLKKLCLAKKETFQEELNFVHKDGSVVYFKCKAISIKNQANEPEKILAAFTNITDIKRKEVFLESCNTAARVGFWEIDLITNNVFWSKTTRDIHDVEADFIPNMENAIAFYKDPREREKINKALNDAVENGIVYDLELQLVTNKGNVRYVRTIGQTERENNLCSRLFGTFQDITDIKLAQGALINEKKKLLNVLEATNLGTWEWNVQTGETIFNDKWADILGYTLDELQPFGISTWINLAHPDDQKIVEEKLNECFERKTEYYLSECRMKHKNGSWVWILDRGKVISWTEDGKPLMMFGTHMDITNQKKYQEQIQIFTEQTPTAIAMFDTDMKYMAASEKWKEEYGLQDKQINGVSHFSLYKMDEEFWKPVLKKCLNGENLEGKEDQFTRNNGTIYWLKWQANPWYKDDKSIGGIIVHTFDITSQKEAESALAEKTALLEAILDQIEVGIVACDQNGSLTLFNRITKEWHGLPLQAISPAEYAGHYGLYTPDSSQLLKTEEIPIIQALRQGCVSTEEMTIIRAKGPARIVTSNGRQLIGPGGNIIGAVVSMHDITEKKMSVERLRISEEIFRGNFDNSALGMAVVSENGNWRKVNNSLCSIVGYTEEELVKLSFQDITHPDDLETDLALVKELLDGERRFYHLEKRYIHKNGSIIHIILAASIVRDEEGKPLYFISQIIDITAQKQAELKLSDALAKIQSILDASTQVSIIGTNTYGNITTFNKGAQNLLGYSREEVINKETPLRIHAESEVDARSAELSKEFDTPIKGFRTFVHLADLGKYDTREWTYVRKDGTTFPVQLTVTPIKRNGITTGYLGIAADISDIKNFEKEIQSLLNVTQDQNDRLRNFAHIVSHNLRSHSTNIQMLLHLFTVEYAELAKNKLIELLNKAANNLKQTIDHLNEVVLMNTLASDNLTSVNLFAAIENAMKNVVALAKESGVVIDNQVDKNIDIPCLPAYLDSIILNLLTNGIKYRSKTRRPEIKLFLKKENGQNVLFVQDNGLGINLKTQGSKIFGMYKTFHGNSDARGIGLFITKNQVEAMGGQIEVESEIDKGTTFKITMKQ